MLLVDRAAEDDSIQRLALIVGGSAIRVVAVGWLLARAYSSIQVATTTTSAVGQHRANSVN
jgi:hypothetical protein